MTHNPPTAAGPTSRKGDPSGPVADFFMAMGRWDGVRVRCEQRWRQDLILALRLGWPKDLPEPDAVELETRGPETRLTARYEAFVGELQLTVLTQADGAGILDQAVDQLVKAIRSRFGTPPASTELSE